MSEPRPPRRTLRSVGSVVAGLLAIFILTTAVDVLLRAAGVFPPLGQPMSDALFLLATAYRVVFGVAGCYLTARLAPDRPMSHALGLGAVGAVLSTVGAVATWGRGLGPAWYPIAVIAMSMPCAWVGGKLRLAQLRAEAAAPQDGTAPY
jgi:hypothetical protein